MSRCPVQYAKKCGGNMTEKHECEGCSWFKWNYYCYHPRWKEIRANVVAVRVMDVCRCPMGRQRRCLKCGKMMKFIKNRPKYHGGEWSCASCETRSTQQNSEEICGV